MEIKAACIRIFDQLAHVLAQIQINDYTQPSEVLGGATVGQHFRHTIEFFICLEASQMSGVVNYDHRAHDASIENDTSTALACIEKIRGFVARASPSQSLTLEVGYDPAKDSTVHIPTNTQRELVYNIEHAVHHMALMKIGLREVAPYIGLSHDFGVAVSTLRWKQRAGEDAPWQAS